MFHMGGWALPLGFWHTGGTVVIMPKAEPRAILDAIARERVTYLYAMPTRVRRRARRCPISSATTSRSLRLLGGGTAAMTDGAGATRSSTRFRCRDMVILYGSDRGRAR